MRKKVQAGAGGEANNNDNDNNTNEDTYATAEDFADDVLLMTANAMTFNERGTIYYKHAKHLKKYLPQLFKKHGLEAASKETSYIPSRRA
eukprot:74087_1